MTYITVHEKKTIRNICILYKIYYIFYIRKIFILTGKNPKKDV